MKKERKGRVGSSFDDFLREEGIYESVTEIARKRVTARRGIAKQARKRKRLAKAPYHSRA
jgi:hypothetical protein